MDNPTQMEYELSLNIRKKEKTVTFVIFKRLIQFSQ